MHIGVDLDNTIIDYDRVFGPVGVALGMLQEGSERLSKLEVRAHLRARPGGEETWMRLQGQVYGAYLDRATPFAGVEDCLRRARTRGAEISIVSHKTRFGHHDPARVKLWDAALDWLRDRGFFSDGAMGLDPTRVHFAETRDSKVGRIKEIGCDVFIDDLPEVLQHPDFPVGTQRIWFANGTRDAVGAGLEIFDTWAEIAARLESFLSLTGDRR